MKVILLKDIRAVGHKGEIKEVTDGYAHNFLFPHKHAEPATEEKMAAYAAQKAEIEAKRHKEEAELTKKIMALRGKKVTLSIRATEKGGLFKSVTAPDIVKAIRAEHSLEVPEAAIHLSEHIKTTGEHPVLLKSKSEKAELMVAVLPA